MSLLDDFARVSRSRRCPICDHTDWCLVSRDDLANPSKVVCARKESRRRFGQAGWLHVLRDDGKRWDGVRHRTIQLAAAPDPTLGSLAEQYRNGLTEPLLDWLASDLGLSAESLSRLGIGWSGAAYSFPMVDSEGRIVGIALRRSNGAKFAVKGGHHGLFVPAGLEPGQRLLVCEGQTDTAAMLDLGFQAVGRAGSRSATRMVCALARRLRPFDVVVVGDGDEPGREGAKHVSSALAVSCSVRVIYPPEGTKDARQWKQHGATRADVEAAIEASTAVRLKVRVVHPGRCP